MRHPLIPLLAMGSVAASACALGPTYRAPVTLEAAAAPFVSATPQASAGIAPPEDWWRLYDDPVLDRLIGQAFAANTDLRAAEANLAQARAVLQGARGGLLPSTALSAGTSYGRSSSGGSAGSSTTGTTNATAQWRYDAAFDVAYEIDLFGRVRRTIEEARADAASVAAARDAVKITIASETARAYVDGCAFAAELDVARQSVKVLQETYDITAARRDAGAASDFDTSRQAALLEQTRAALPTLQGQRQAALFELAALLGLTPSQVPAEAQTCTATPTIHTPLPVGDGAALLKRRPDIREAERHLAAQTARIGVATADLFPTISLGGSISGAAGLQSGSSSHGVSFGIGPLISWSFPNVLGARARIAGARAGEQAALASFDGVVLTALKETEQALSTYANELDRNAALQRGAGQSERAYRLAQVRFNAGAQSELELLTTQQALVSARSALAASNESVAADQIAVFKALGGGWRTP